MNTRSKPNIWLIGQVSDKFNQHVLPTKREVLSLFMKYKNNDNKTLSESLTSTTNDVLSVWAKAQIPTTNSKMQCCNEIENIVWRMTETQEK